MHRLEPCERSMNAIEFCAVGQWTLQQARGLADDVTAFEAGDPRRAVRGVA